MHVEDAEARGASRIASERKPQCSSQVQSPSFQLWAPIPTRSYQKLLLLLMCFVLMASQCIALPSPSIRAFKHGSLCDQWGYELCRHRGIPPGAWILRVKGGNDGVHSSEEENVPRNSTVSTEVDHTLDDPSLMRTHSAETHSELRPTHKRPSSLELNLETGHIPSHSGQQLQDFTKMSKTLLDFAGVGSKEGSTSNEKPMRLEDLMEAVGPRCFPVILFLTSLPNCIPGPPLLNFIFGFPQILMAAQFALGMKRPWLPRCIYRAHLPKDMMKSVLSKVLAPVQRIERLTRARWLFMEGVVIQRILGVFILSLAVTLTMPVPFSTQPASIALAIITLGMAERDGKCVAVGCVLGVLAEFICAGIVYLWVFYGKEAVWRIFRTCGKFFVGKGKGA